jgi:hypothetical protein
MDNREAIETFNVISQLDGERGMPIKFEYGLARLRNNLKSVVTTLQELQSAKIDGQDEYQEARAALLKSHAVKDEEGVPKTKPAPNGVEYVIGDQVSFKAALADLNKEHQLTIDAIDFRAQEFDELLKAEADFEPYLINCKYLPTDKDGASKLTVVQLRHIMPFLIGDIEDLPDCD